MSLLPLDSILTTLADLREVEGDGENVVRTFVSLVEVLAAFRVRSTVDHLLSDTVVALVHNTNLPAHLVGNIFFSEILWMC